MLPYKSTYIKLFPILMKKYMIEQFGKEITKNAFKKAPAIYKEMLNQVDDIGAENPMAGNVYMAFVLMAIWKASDGAIDNERYRIVVKDMITKSIARKFVAKNDLNKPDGVSISRQRMQKMKDWADEHPEYLDKTWDINFDDNLHKDGFYYHFTHCPINTYARKYGYIEILPVCCELDHLLTQANHGRLIREYTLATDGPMCDYWIVPDKIENPQ